MTTNKKLVFLLEDNVPMREVMKDFLELQLPEDCEVHDFAELGALKQACKQIQPALIVSDLNVLDARPAEVIDFLQADIPPSLPVIISSSSYEYTRVLAFQERFKVYTKGEPLLVLTGFVDSCIGQRMSPST
jgi:CheY-like chemotaxis protein